MKKGQVSVQIIFAFAILLLILLLIIALNQQKIEEKKLIEENLKLGNQCKNVSSTISKIFLGQEGMKTEINLKNRTRISSDKIIIVDSANQDYFCNFQAVIKENADANNLIEIRKENGVVVIEKK